MRLLILLLIIIGGCSTSKEVVTDSSRLTDSGMRLIETQVFTMGTDSKHAYPTEWPARNVEVKAFWIDETEITNKAYAKFVEATGYLTVAERTPDWQELKKQLPPDAKKPADHLLVPASLVFHPPTEEANLDEVTWWDWVPGASWKSPEGGTSNIKGMDDHPVIHMALEDAQKYCEWKKMRLPTEAEWELAARGKLANATYAWGEEFKPNGKFMANTYQGKFPGNNLNEDGFLTTAPVKSFPANGYGLFDMIGNVWEWTSDKYEDLAEPLVKKQVIKGGSFLCAENHCVNYRPSARLGAAFDSGASHLGFRCVKDHFQ